jgi:hypothetical protein
MLNLKEKKMRVLNVTKAVVAALALVWAAPSMAQNLDLDEVGALLALPVVTASGPTVTAVTVTNAGPAVNMHVNVISGDRGDYWRAQDFDCPVTAHETVLFVFEPDAKTAVIKSFDRNRGYDNGSLLTFECSTAAGEEITVKDQPLDASEGIMVITLEDPETGETVNSNQVFGDFVVIDFAAGAAYSAGAIPFQGVIPGTGVGDRKYRFDNVEYTRFPSALATNFIAPDYGDINAELILFTLDGSTGQTETPPAQVSIKFYNDDEVQFSSSHHFDCFDIVRLTDIDGRFERDSLGSPAGHLVLTPELVTYPNLAHDASFDGGPGSVLGVRKPPVHGWLVQAIKGGGDIDITHYDSTASASNKAAWARTLAQSQLPIVVSSGDTPVLNAP